MFIRVLPEPTRSSLGCRLGFLLALIPVGIRLSFLVLLDLGRRLGQLLVLCGLPKLTSVCQPGLDPFNFLWVLDLGKEELLPALQPTTLPRPRPTRRCCSAPAWPWWWQRRVRCGRNRQSRRGLASTQGCPRVRPCRPLHVVRDAPGQDWSRHWVVELVELVMETSRNLGARSGNVLIGKVQETALTAIRRRAIIHSDTPVALSLARLCATLEDRFSDSGPVISQVTGPLYLHSFHSDLFWHHASSRWPWGFMLLTGEMSVSCLLKTQPVLVRQLDNSGFVLISQLLSP